MSLAQVYYTSCQHGMRGGPGFQINAATPGLDPSTLALVERFSGYHPPLSLAYSREAALDRYPRALTFYRLGPGRYALGHSVYLGRTAGDARGGNFFTHTLVSSAGPDAFGGAAPVAFWDEAFWAAQAVDTLELPPLELKRPALDDVAVEQFIGADAARTPYLEQLIEAVQQCVRHTRTLYLVAPAEECARWIAAATLALPHHLAYEVTFTTYTRSPGTLPLHIVGVDPESIQAVRQQAGAWVFVPSEGPPAPALRATAYAVMIGHVHRNRKSVTLVREPCAQLDRPLTFDELNPLATLLMVRAEASDDTVPTLVAFAQRLFPEPKAVMFLKPLLKLFDTPELLQPALVAGLRELYRQALAAGDQPGAAVVVERYLLWLAGQLRPDSSLAELAAIEADLAALAASKHSSPTMPAVAAALDVALRSAVAHEQRDTPRLVVLLRLAVRYGSTDDAAQQAALIALLERSPLHQEVAALIEELCAAGSAGAPTALADALAEAQAPADLEGWWPLLQRASLRAALASEAARRGNSALYLYLRARGSEPGRRLPELAGLTADLHTRFPGQTVEAIVLDRWYIAVVFPEPQIAIADGQWLLDRVEPWLVGTTTLFDRIANGLLEATAPSGAQPLAVARTLLVCSAAHGRQLPWLEPYLHCWQQTYGYDREPEALFHAVGSLLAVLPTDAASARRQALWWGFQRVMEQPNMALALKGYLAALSPHAGELWPAVEAGLQSPERPASDTERFCLLFAALAYHHDQQSRRPVVEQIDRGLRHVWQCFDGREQREIDRKLRQGDVAEPWRQWRSKERRGLLGWLG